MVEVNRPQIEEAVRMILEAIGEDPSREGLLDTPKRVAKMMKRFFRASVKILKFILILFLEKNMKNLFS